jgi:tetratricopeptide (TPR) repeat protein
MSNIKPTTPSFTFGYWRPWKENSNMYDSFFDYAKDVSLAKYGADTVGQYIAQASVEQVGAINQLGQKIGAGLNVLSNQMSDVSNKLNFLNRNIGIQIEQQKLSNLLLQNISQLLRVPDSEKERQHAIELGVKFFVNANLDLDLFDDALEELLKAELLMKQDYFVLHRIGLIYLHVPKHINVEKALDYFTKAAKYASIESNPETLKLVNALNGSFKNVNYLAQNDVQTLAADSFEKAAFASYVLGQFELAIKHQSKALEYAITAENYFMLAKYQSRSKDIISCLSNLEKAIDIQPLMLLAVFKEIDLINEPKVLLLISEKNQHIDKEIETLIGRWKKIECSESNDTIRELTELSKKSYEIKISDFVIYNNKKNIINHRFGVIKAKIDALIDEVKLITFLTFDAFKVQNIIIELENARTLSLEIMNDTFNKISEEVNSNKLQIGARYAGGIVFYLDSTGQHGLVCSEKELVSYGVIWGASYRVVGASGRGIGDGSGLENTKKIVDTASWVVESSFFSKTRKPLVTAARICLESNQNDFTDWYLPTIDELSLIYKNLKSKNLYTFIGNYYWSSTETDINGAYSFWFPNGERKIHDNYRIAECFVLGVRCF